MNKVIVVIERGREDALVVDSMDTLRNILTKDQINSATLIEGVYIPDNKPIHIEPSNLTIKQHSIVKWSGNRREEYSIHNEALSIIKHSHWRPATTKEEIPLRKIDHIKVSTPGLMGWMFRYRTVVIDVGDDKFTLNNIRKEDAIKIENLLLKR